MDFGTQYLGLFVITLLHLCVWAAVPIYHTLSSLNSRLLFLMALESGSYRSSEWPGRLHSDASFLACRQLSYCLLT